MRKGSGAGINLIFCILALLLAGALTGIGIYAVVHKPEKVEAEPVIAETTVEKTEPTEKETVTTETSSEADATSTPKATTTTAAAAATTAPPRDRTEYHGFNETITEKAPDVKYVLSFEDSGDVLHIYNDDKWTVSDFKDSSVASVSKGKDASSFNTYINSAAVTDTKSDIGISAGIKNGNKLSVESFGGECTELKIVSNNDKYADLSFKADTKKGTLEADLTDSSFQNSLYVIHGEYTEGGKTYPINVYLFVNCKSNDENDFHFYLCSLKDESDAKVPASSGSETASEPTTVSTETTTA